MYREMKTSEFLKELESELEKEGIGVEITVEQGADKWRLKSGQFYKAKKPKPNEGVG